MESVDAHPVGAEHIEVCAVGAMFGLGIPPLTLVVDILRPIHLSSGAVVDNQLVEFEAVILEESANHKSVVNSVVVGGYHVGIGEVGVAVVAIPEYVQEVVDGAVAAGLVGGDVDIVGHGIVEHGVENEPRQLAVNNGVVDSGVGAGNDVNDVSHHAVLAVSASARHGGGAVVEEGDVAINQRNLGVADVMQDSVVDIGPHLEVVVLNSVAGRTCASPVGGGVGVVGVGGAVVGVGNAVLHNGVEDRIDNRGVYREFQYATIDNLGGGIGVGMGVCASLIVCGVEEDGRVVFADGCVRGVVVMAVFAGIDGEGERIGAFAIGQHGIEGYVVEAGREGVGGVGFGGSGAVTEIPQIAFAAVLK